MNILIDTHILIWALFNPEKLKVKEKEILLNPNNNILVSVISLWEISLKYSLKKITLKNTSPEEIINKIEKSGFEIISLDKYEATSYHLLPELKNKDPFDKMLMWQSINYGFYFLTRDKKCKKTKKIGLKLI